MNEKDSLLNKVAQLVHKVLPDLPYLGVYTYTVTRDNGDGTLDLAPAPEVLHGPRLRVEQRAAPGMEAGLSVGDEVLIVFRQPGNRPAIIGHAPLNESKPGTLKIDCTGVMTIGETATAINVGGPSAVFLAKAPPLVTWAALVVTSVNQAAAYINAIVPGTVTPLAALASPATTKAKGV